MGRARATDHLNLGGSNRLLTLPEAAAFLGTTYGSLRNHYAEWDIPTVKVGRNVRVRERDLNAWIEHRVRGGRRAS